MRVLALCVVVAILCSKLAVGHVKCSNVEADSKSASHSLPESWPLDCMLTCERALRNPKSADYAELSAITTRAISPMIVAAAWLAIARTDKWARVGREGFLRSFPAGRWCQYYDVPAQWKWLKDRDDAEQRYCLLCEMCLEGVHEFALKGSRLAICLLLETSENSWAEYVDVLRNRMSSIAERRLSDVAKVWEKWARRRDFNSVLFLLGAESPQYSRLCRRYRRGVTHGSRAVREMCRMLLAPLP